MDPHLHRVASLDTLYRIQTAALLSTPAIAAWVRTHVADPHIVGPDEESAQWVSGVGALAVCPYSVLRKHRSGDRSVELTLPNLDALRGRTPVLVDDIISSGQTMAATVHRLLALGLAAPTCIGVQPVFAGDAFAALQAAGAARIVSCNTLLHPSNAIDVTELLAGPVRVGGPLDTGVATGRCAEPRWTARPPIHAHRLHAGRGTPSRSRLPRVSIQVLDREQMDASLLGALLFRTLYRLWPESFDIDKTLPLIGAQDTLRELRDGVEPAVAAAHWQLRLDGFQARRRRYLLY